MGFKARCKGVPTRRRSGVDFVWEWRDFPGKPTKEMLADKYLEIKEAEAKPRASTTMRSGKATSKKD